MNKQTFIQVDHCPPGFKSNLGSQSEWANSYRQWLMRRGFTDELRSLDMASRRSPAFLRKKKKLEQEEQSED